MFFIFTPDLPVKEELNLISERILEYEAKLDKQADRSGRCRLPGSP
jgi:hypothetical protein